MDSYSFLISDGEKLIIPERCELFFDEDSEQAEFIENMQFLRHPRQPVLHLIDGKKLIASIHMEPTRFWQQRRKGFAADVDTDELRITVRICELDRRVYGVMVLVSQLPPLKDIHDTLARAGIEGDVEATKLGQNAD